MHEDPDASGLTPPGTYLESIGHPSGNTSRELELAIFKEHRFAFYFWNRWNQLNNKQGPPPTLVTIDWHRDLAPPSDSEQNSLEQLNLTDDLEIARFVWSRLDPHNDSHLLSAAYLNVIGDVVLLKNYGEEQNRTYEDFFGNEHRIHEMNDYTLFEEQIVKNNDTPVFLDIDLDYFIEDKVAPHQLDDVTLFTDEKIRDVIDPDSRLFRFLFQKLEGITIATEPRYCGGILKSNHILNVVLSQLFTTDLKWKHLQ